MRRAVRARAGARASDRACGLNRLSASAPFLFGRRASPLGCKLCLILGRASAAIEIVVLEIGDQGCRGTNSVSCHDIKNPAPGGCFRWAHGASLRIYVIVRSWNTTTLLVKNGCKRLSPRLDRTRKSRRKSDSAKLPIIVERSNVIPVITRRPWGRTSPADIPPLSFSPGAAPAPSWRQNLLQPPSF